MNRGVEIDSDLADDINRSVIGEQVEMGVAVRMAVLELLSRNVPNEMGERGVTRGSVPALCAARRSARPRHGGGGRPHPVGRLGFADKP